MARNTIEPEMVTGLQVLVIMGAIAFMFLLIGKYQAITDYERKTDKMAHDAYCALPVHSETLCNNL